MLLYLVTPGLSPKKERQTKTKTNSKKTNKQNKIKIGNNFHLNEPSDDYHIRPDLILKFSYNATLNTATEEMLVYCPLAHCEFLKNFVVSRTSSQKTEVRSIFPMLVS